MQWQLAATVVDGAEDMMGEDKGVRLLPPPADAFPVLPLFLSLMHKLTLIHLHRR